MLFQGTKCLVIWCSISSNQYGYGSNQPISVRSIMGFPLSAGLFLWPQRLAILFRVPQQCTCLLIPLPSSTTAQFRGPHYSKVFESCVYSVSHWPLNTTSWTHSTQSLPSPLYQSCPWPRVTCQIQWSGSVFSYLSPCKNWIFSPPIIYFMCLLKTVPPTSLASSSLPLLLVPPHFFFFKKKLTSQC